MVMNGTFFGADPMRVLPCRSAERERTVHWWRFHTAQQF